MDYRPRQLARLGALDAARTIDDPGERVRGLFQAHDTVGEFMRATLGRTLIYAAEVAASIAHTVDDVDRAMRGGFGWDQGPFELWDAIGVDAVLDACGGDDLSAAARELGQTQPTIGRQVSALEDSLGVALFDRAGRGLILTDAGRELLTHVREMAEAAARIFAALAEAQINLDMIVQNVSAASTNLTDISFTLPRTDGKTQRVIREYT